jgi:hypothetical protein
MEEYFLLSATPFRFYAATTTAFFHSPHHLSIDHIVFACQILTYRINHLPDSQIFEQNKVYFTHSRGHTIKKILVLSAIRHRTRITNLPNGIQLFNRSSFSIVGRDNVPCLEIALGYALIRHPLLTN